MYCFIFGVGKLFEPTFFKNATLEVALSFLLLVSNYVVNFNSVLTMV